MNEYCRPATLDDLKAVVRFLNEHGAEYLLIGGYALYAHGLYRATEDIDILVPATRESGERIREALKCLPDGAAAGLDMAWFDEGENIQVLDDFRVDVMLNACGQTYESLKGYAETVMLDGVPVRTITAEGLLLTKQGVRPKDIEDRVALEGAIDACRRRDQARYSPCEAFCNDGDAVSAQRIGQVDDETIRRNLRKTPEERLDTLIASVREAERRGLVPEREDRKKKEETLNCLIRKKS